MATRWKVHFRSPESSAFDVFMLKASQHRNKHGTAQKTDGKIFFGGSTRGFVFLLFRLSRSRFHEKFKLFYYLFWSFSWVPAFAEWSSKIVQAEGENPKSELIRNWREKSVSAKNKCGTELFEKKREFSFLFSLSSRIPEGRLKIFLQTRQRDLKNLKV